MFATVRPQPTRKSKSTTKKVSQRVKPLPKTKRTASRKKQFVPVTHQEHLHYMVEFEKFLRPKYGKPISNTPGYLQVLDLFATHGITELGQREADRIRRELQKFLPKYNPSA